MTTPDPIDAAIAASHDAFWDTLATGDANYDDARAAAIRAAAPILIAAGREQAARALDEQLWWDTAASTPTVRKADLLHIARGGTP